MEMKKVVVVQDVIVSVQGKSQALQAGEEVLLPVPVADDLMRAGYVIYKAPPKPEPVRRASTKSVTKPKRK